MSNMRSSNDAPQLLLWEDEPARPRPARQREGQRSGRPSEPAGEVVVEGLEFASRGWGPGTVLLVRPATRAARGQMVVVRDGQHHEQRDGQRDEQGVRVGVLGLDVGRRALFTDRGATWLAEGARVIGVVVAAEPPLVF